MQLLVIFVKVFLNGSVMSNEVRLLETEMTTEDLTSVNTAVNCKS